MNAVVSYLHYARASGFVIQTGAFTAAYVCVVKMLDRCIHCIHCMSCLTRMEVDGTAIHAASVATRLDFGCKPRRVDFPTAVRRLHGPYPTTLNERGPRPRAVSGQREEPINAR